MNNTTEDDETEEPSPRGRTALFSDEDKATMPPFTVHRKYKIATRRIAAALTRQGDRKVSMAEVLREATMIGLRQMARELREQGTKL